MAGPGSSSGLYHGPGRRKRDRNSPRRTKGRVSGKLQGYSSDQKLGWVDLVVTPEPDAQPFLPNSYRVTGPKQSLANNGIATKIKFNPKY